MTTKQRSARPAGVRAVPVLIATDGSSVAASAVKWAALMAKRGAWAPEAVTVLEPVPVSVVDAMLGAPPVEAQQLYGDSVLGRIRRQLQRRGGGEWPLAVEFGRPAPTIARFARDRAVELIVMGLGRHGRLARVVGAETAGRVMSQSDVPVLAVAEGIRRLPRTAVVAVDFGPSSARAAREALALLVPPARLHLLHVRWAIDGKTLYDTGIERTYALGAEEAFRRLVGELAAPEGVRVTHEMRLGGIVETTLSVAKKLHADLVAAGRHSRTMLDRVLIGSTPAHLLRVAPCSVLVVPPVDDGQ